jgi:isopenicillin-N N-acyltransferase like protein
MSLRRSVRRSVRRLSVASCCSLLLLVCCSASFAQQSKFAPGKFQNGALRFVQGIPLVTVSGTPEEIGEQLGTLFKKPLGDLLSKREDVSRGFGFRQSAGVAIKTGRLVLPAFPENQRRELYAVAKAASVDPDLLTFENIVYEISHFPACSTLAVEPSRSATNGVLMGRNLDFPTFGFLDKYSVLIVYRPEGKHAFATATFPGMLGVFSGMNDAGLCIAQLEVNSAADGSSRLNLLGTPISMCFRRLLEECTTIEQAEKLLREQRRMMTCNLAICDREHSAVFEVTPKSVVRRPAEDGLCACTNHFRTPGMALNKQCWRYDKLSQSRKVDKLAITDLAKLMDSANQGQFTIQTMIFEPSALRMHLSFGPVPSSSQRLKPIDLAGLLAPVGAAE